MVNVGTGSGDEEEDDEVRAYAVDAYYAMIEGQKLTDALIQSIAWVCFLLFSCCDDVRCPLPYLFFVLPLFSGIRVVGVVYGQILGEFGFMSNEHEEDVLLQGLCDLMNRRVAGTVCVLLLADMFSWIVWVLPVVSSKYLHLG